MRTKCLKALRRLFADTSGTSVIELGVIAPLFGLFAISSVDFGLTFAQKLRYEQAAQRAVEMASAAGRIGTDYTYVRQEAATAAGVPLANVAMQTTLECNDVPQADFYAVCPNANDQVARYISISITGTYTPAFPLGPIAAHMTGTTVPVQGDAVVRLQ